MPHIKKRNKIYHVFWYEQGKHHSKAIGPSLKDAETWAANLTLRLYSKKNGLPIRYYPFNDFLKEYAEEYIKFKSKRTQERDITTLKHLLRLFKDFKYVSEFNELALKQYILYRTQEGASKATINRELGTLKNMQKVAFEKKYLEENISLKTKFLDIKDNTTTYVPSDKEIQYIFNKIHEPLKTAFVLGLTCGMRSGEVCHIELQDIDFDNNIINIRPKPHLEWAPKNQTSIRNVPIHPQYKDYLLKRYNFANKVKSNLICCYDDGRALTEDVISALIGKLRRKDSKIDKRFHFHTLRHKFITISANSGIPMIQLKNIVGHANTKVTENIYYHSSDQKNIEAVAKIDMPLTIKNR